MDQNLKNNIGGILYLIGLTGDEGFKFRIRLQKLILLSKLEEKFPFSFSYESHYYGPYSVQLQSMLDDLISSGFVSEKIISTGEDNSGFVYFLTQEGLKFSKKLSIQKGDLKKLDIIKTKYFNEPTDFIVRRAKRISGIKSISEI